MKKYTFNVEVRETDIDGNETDQKQILEDIMQAVGAIWDAISVSSKETPRDDIYGDYISIHWGIDDVRSLDDTLTDQQCRDVLAAALANHDATIGINWDVLQYYIDERIK